MSEKTAGQQACIAWNEAFGEQFGIIAADEWELGDPRGRLAWEAAAQAARADVIAERDKAYRERARLVAFLAACYESEMTQESDDDPWPVVYVLGPTGQMSWHIARADLGLFDHVGWYGTEPAWDGHTTEEKYERLATLIPHAADAREQLASTRERLLNLAAGLDMSASTTEPSKKSGIERGCAAAVRQIAEAR